jgi:GGDEF domain-containing protein
MRKTLGWLLVVLSFSVAALALGSVLFSIGELRNSGERASGAEYSIIRNALTGIRTKDDLRDDFLRQRLIALYKGSDRLLAAQVLDESGLVVWKLPGDSSYFALPGSPSSRAGFSAPDLSTVVFTTPLNNGMKLATLFATLRKADLAKAIKTPLIFLAVWFGLMVAAFFVFGGKKASQKPGLEQEADKGTIAQEEKAAQPAIDAEAETAAPCPVEEPLSENRDSLSSHNVETQINEAIQTEPDEPFVKPTKEVRELDQNLQEKEKSASWIAATKEINENKPLEAHDENKEDELLEEDETLEEIEEGKTVPGGKKNFEESLARLEEEISNWSSKHGDVKTLEPIAEDAAQPEEAQETQEFIESLEEEEELVELEELSKREEIHEEPQTLKPEQKDIPSKTPENLSPAPDSSLASLPLPLSLIDSELEAKLREELERGLKSEVSLMLIHCSVNSATDPAALALAVTVRDYIGAKDLIFELYKGAFAVVLPSVDLGGSLKMSEDLADVLSATLGLYRDIEGEAPVYIGISARNERKIDEFKLYREASTALHKAYEGGQSRILAFRPKVE